MTDQELIATDRITILRALNDAKLQLEYLDSRFPTGSTPPVLARISDALEGALPWHVIASAIEARSDATGTGAAEGESAAPEGGDAK